VNTNASRKFQHQPDRQPSVTLTTGPGPDSGDGSQELLPKLQCMQQRSRGTMYAAVAGLKWGFIQDPAPVRIKRIEKGCQSIQG
jgi:hypothetical protein